MREQVKLSHGGPTLACAGQSRSVDKLSIKHFMRSIQGQDGWISARLCQATKSADLSSPLC